MMPRGFKPVGWVAAVGGAALGCYMLSLNVAAERAELARIEREIVIAKQDIRSLHTELGTRGRLKQLEHWNAEVLALSAPTSAQFLEDTVTLARFETRDKSFEEKARVQMASANAVTPAPVVAQPDAAEQARKLPPVRYAVATESPVAQPLLRQASYVPGDMKLAPAGARVVAKPAPSKVVAKPEPRKAEAAKGARKPDAGKGAKPSSLKSLVASLDDKPAAVGGGKSKAEAGLR